MMGKMGKAKAYAKGEKMESKAMKAKEVKAGMKKKPAKKKK